VDDIRDSLGISCAARPAAPDSVVNLCELVRDSVGNICSRGRSAVCAQYYAILEVDCHARGAVRGCEKAVVLVVQTSRCPGCTCLLATCGRVVIGVNELDFALLQMVHVDVDPI
jgi:hypothetical protein